MSADHMKKINSLRVLQFLLRVFQFLLRVFQFLLRMLQFLLRVFQFLLRMLQFLLSVPVLAESVTVLAISPLTVAGVSEQHKLCLGKRKLGQIQDAMSHKVADIFEDDQEQLSDQPAQSTRCCSSDDMDRLAISHSRKENLKFSSSQKQVQLLTRAPQRWTISKPVHELGVSEYKVKEKGVLTETQPKAGKSLSKDVEEHVVSFYEEDERLRLLPGAEDYKSVKQHDGTRVHKQKRLLLLNLNELYQN